MPINFPFSTTTREPRLLFSSSSRASYTELSGLTVYTALPLVCRIFLTVPISYGFRTLLSYYIFLLKLKNEKYFPGLSDCGSYSKRHANRIVKKTIKSLGSFIKFIKDASANFDHKL